MSRIIHDTYAYNVYTYAHNKILNVTEDTGFRYLLKHLPFTR